MGNCAAGHARTADVLWDRPSGRLRLGWEFPSERVGMTDGGVIRGSAGWIRGSAGEITRLIRTRDAERPRGSTTKDNHTRALLSRLAGRLPGRGFHEGGRHEALLGSTVARGA